MIALVIFLAVVFGPGAAGPELAAPAPAPLVTMAACIAEDGSEPGQEFPCRWHAPSRGNGLGQSFTMAADRTVTYY